MLVLSRKLGERVRIGDAEVTIIRIGQAGVRLGIDAPDGVKILRAELRETGDRRQEDASTPHDGRGDAPVS